MPESAPHVRQQMRHNDLTALLERLDSLAESVTHQQERASRLGVPGAAPLLAVAATNILLARSRVALALDKE